MTSTARYWLVLLALFAAAYGTLVAWRGYERPQADFSDSAAAGLVQPLPSLYSAKLTDQAGAEFSFGSLRGRIWVGSVFFANCPGPCWKLNEALTKLQTATAGTDVQLVSVTCDPDNDTVETLTAYARRFSAEPQRWRFLTGQMSALRRVAAEGLHLAFEGRSHSSACQVFDRSGAARGHFSPADPDDFARMSRLITRLLAESSDAAAPAAAGSDDDERAGDAPAQ